MNNQLVTIMKFTKLFAVRFVKEKLESDGIECFLTDEGFDSSGEGLSLGWNLKVRPNDVEQTVKILLQINKEYDLAGIEEDSTIKYFKKILVPVDLRKYSVNTCKYAFEIADLIHAEIKFLYILDDPNLFAPIQYRTSWEEHEKIEREEVYQTAHAMLLEFSDDFKIKMAVV